MNVLALLIAGVLSLSVERIPETNQPPPQRLYHSMVYNPVNHSLIMFGGEQDNTILFNDLWSFDLATQRWSVFPSSSSEWPR